MKFAAYLLVGIGLGLGFAYWQTGGSSGNDWSGGELALDEQAPVEQRLRQLETALALERYEREVLAEDLAALEAILSAVPAETAQPAGPPQDPRARLAAALDGEVAAGPMADRLRQRLEAGFPGGLDESAREQRQLERLVDTGLSPDRAQWILQRQDELEMEVLQARYDATQGGASAAEVAGISTTQRMRQELGDADYEKYLQGLGRPTTVNVRDVLTNSPAQLAGLEPGDQIIAYDGQRVFEMNELNGLTYAGEPGETVAIDVIRDGQQMQLYVERGPIGVSGGGRSVRRRP